MTLPQKKSRIIEIDGKKYRWLISKPSETIELSIEAAHNSGQLLQVSFESNDSFKRDKDNQCSNKKTPNQHLVVVEIMNKRKNFF